MELIQNYSDIQIYKVESYQIIKDGEIIELTQTEAKILALLMRYKGYIVPNDVIIRQVWGYAPDRTILRVNMSNLRRKIGHIKTIKGKGYQIE